MKLYVTYTSPYARLARIVVMEKALEDRVEILEAKIRAAGTWILYYATEEKRRIISLVLRHDVCRCETFEIRHYLDIPKSRCFKIFVSMIGVALVNPAKQPTNDRATPAWQSR